MLSFEATDTVEQCFSNFSVSEPILKHWEGFHRRVFKKQLFRAAEVLLMWLSLLTFCIKNDKF